MLVLLLVLFLLLLRTPGPMAAPSILWGILGPGSIAERHSIAKSYSSYEELVHVANVDIVYISSPNCRHHEHTMLALAAGKRVLVEKSFAANAAQAREMVEEAERRGLCVASQRSLSNRRAETVSLAGVQAATGVDAHLAMTVGTGAAPSPSCSLRCSIHTVRCAIHSLLSGRC